jgi:peptidoglycan/LPS O-acetylase OafA/YrhL
MKVNYRKEIDGLRAVAVLAVIIYHSKVNLLEYEIFKGGFIGVDIFFVISGYLITLIILKELNETGNFSLKKFYERRVRRILPALLVVVLASIPFGWMYILPSSFIEFSKSIIYSLGYSSNFYFWFSGQQYGADDGLLKPFLHTWSLSVEEQFYILFPLILMASYIFLKKYIIYIFILIFLVSLGLSNWTSLNYESLSFYFLHTRAWEILAGSFLAYFEIHLGRRSNNKKLNYFLPSVGFFLIICSFFYLDDTMLHPSFLTLVPVVGVCFIIWFSDKDEIITKVLSTKLCVGIGLISYSLYLWHYPIFAFIRISEMSSDSLIKKLLFGGIIFLLAILSYYLVEKPSRNKKNPFKYIFLFIAVLYFLIIFLSTNIILKKGYAERLEGQFTSKILNYGVVDVDFYCNNCRYNTNSNKKFFLIGDSHAGRMVSNLKDRVAARNFQFIPSTISQGGCLFYPGIKTVYKKTNKIVKECDLDYYDKLVEELSSGTNQIIVFAGRLPLHLNEEVFNNQEGGIETKINWYTKYISTGVYKNIGESFKTEVLKLSKLNKIILVYPIPEVGFNINSKLFINKKIKKKIELSNYVTTSYDVYKTRTSSSFKLLNSIKGKNIYRVYPHSMFCDTLIKNRCLTHDNKTTFYDDSNHLSRYGSKSLNNLIVDIMDQIKNEK